MVPTVPTVRMMAAVAAVAEPTRRRLFAVTIAASATLAAGCPRPAAPVEPPGLLEEGEPPEVAAAPIDAATAEAPPSRTDGCLASVAWRGGALEAVGLPCIRRDGSELVFAKSDERPRYPDLTVVGVTRADKLVRHAVVMEAHESAELLDAARRPMPELDARITKANAMLAEAAAAAVPLTAFAPTPAGTHAGDGLEVAWTEKGRITISREGRFVHAGDYNHWLEKLTACEPPSYLDKVWGDAQRGALLVKIAYRGSGGCTAMPELHVISWTPAP